MHVVDTQQEQLEPSWLDWVTRNLARGCDPAAMHAAMVNGGISAHAARRALRDARGHSVTSNSNFSARPGRPDVSTNTNQWRIEGHPVSLGFETRSPRIVLVNHALTHEECDALVLAASDRLKASFVVDQDQPTYGKRSSVRTSDGAAFRHSENPTIDLVEKRLAALVSWPASHGEGMQILRYTSGQEYKPHFDYFSTTSKGGRFQMRKGGQRVGTILLYLSDVARGGGTTFPSIGGGLTVFPSKGSALFFADIDPNERPDPLTLHAGSPVIEGCKWVATKWLRAGPV